MTAAPLQAESISERQQRLRELARREALARLEGHRGHIGRLTTEELESLSDAEGSATVGVAGSPIDSNE